MVTYTFTNGTVADADEVNQNFTDVEEMSAKFAQVPYSTLKVVGSWTNEGNLAADRFTDADGINNTINTGSTTANFVTNCYKIGTVVYLDPYVIIEANSLTPSNFEINDCVVKTLSSNKWAILNTATTYEERRAKIYKTLFYGTNGSNPKITGVTGLTNLKTSVPKDIGKKAIYSTATVSDFANSNDNAYLDYTGTFSNTTDNTGVSSWSYCSSGGDVTAYWRMPSGTNLNIDTDEMGTDTSGDELDNPADCRIRIQGGNSVIDGSGTTRVLILGDSNITWVETNGNNFSTSNGSWSSSNTDFNSDHSIPYFTEATETITYDYSIIVDTGTLTLKGEEVSISVYNPSLIPTDTSIKCILNDGVQDISAETTLSENDTTTIPLTTTPTAGNTLELHYTLETTDNTVTPEFYGYGVMKK